MMRNMVRVVGAPAIAVAALLWLTSIRAGAAGMAAGAADTMRGRRIRAVAAGIGPGAITTGIMGIFTTASMDSMATRDTIRMATGTMADITPTATTGTAGTTMAITGTTG